AKETGEWDRAKTRTVMENFLTAHPGEIDLVYCHDGNMCFGAVEAIKEAGLMDEIKVVGINGNQEEYDAIRKGEFYGTILNDASCIAVNDIQRARDILESRPILPEYICPAAKITKENVDDYVAYW
ncbi:MAG: sugar ABC transporter substrate-binding protein, partial [Anaerolineae bacterium]